MDKTIKLSAIMIIIILVATASFLIMLLLKLAGIIALSWLAVTSPIWGTILLGLIFILVCVLPALTHISKSDGGRHP